MGGAQRARFIEETQILARLEHRYIAGLLRSGRTGEGRPFYVMEFVEGVTLNHWAKEKTLREKVAVIRQVAEAVSHAHVRGVAHRDLKPGNVLVRDGEEGAEVKVIDFGIARAFEGPESWGRESTMAGERLGTPLYMSPEQLEGGGEVDFRADVWAMGLLLYEVVLGEPVLRKVIGRKGSWTGAVERLRQFTFPSLHDEELDWIGRKACALEADGRYESGAAFLHDLEAWEAGEVVSVGMSYRGYRFRKWLRQHPLGVMAMVSFAVILVLVGAGGWWLSVKEGQRVKEVSAARDLAEAAEMNTRREASDTALLAAVQAMGAGDFREAGVQLAGALERWPENEEARFAQDFLGTTRPQAKLIKAEEVGYRPLEVTVTNEGDFEVRDADGESHRVTLAGWKTWSGGEKYEGRFEGVGRMGFYLKETGDEMMAPLVFGAGREWAGFSNRDGLVLVAKASGKLEWWDVRGMEKGVEAIKPERKVGWVEFEREGLDVWMILEEGVQEWRANGSLSWHFGVPDLMERDFRWQTGEGISTGLPKGLAGLTSIWHLAAWKKNDESRQLVATLGGRRSDEFWVMGNDGRLGRQRKGGTFKVIKGVEGKGRMMGLDADGRSMMVITEEGLGFVIRVAEEMVSEGFPVGEGATSVVILDGGKEALVAYDDGYVRVWNLERLEKVKEIEVAPGAVRNDQFFVRTIPGRQEFLCTLEGDLEIRRFSVESGKQIGRGLRHEHGVWWFFTSSSEDVIFSVDQSADLKGPGVVRVWSLRLGRELVPALKYDSAVNWVTVLDGGRRIAVVTTDGWVRRWAVRETQE